MRRALLALTVAALMVATIAGRSLPQMSTAAVVRSPAIEQATVAVLEAAARPTATGWRCSTGTYAGLWQLTSATCRFVNTPGTWAWYRAAQHCKRTKGDVTQWGPPVFQSGGVSVSPWCDGTKVDLRYVITGVSTAGPGRS